MLAVANQDNGRQSVSVSQSINQTNQQTIKRCRAAENPTACMPIHLHSFLG